MQKMNDRSLPWAPQFADTVPVALPSDERPAVSPASDSTFVTLLAAYRAAGGLARRDEVLRRLATTRRQARRRRNDLPDPGESVCFEWSGIQWWPLFQFDVDMCMRPAVARIARELAGVLADWELALWFITPNDWLGNRLPIECVSADRDATLHAARADRFVAAG
jgi:hypothetical protein